MQRFEEPHEAREPQFVQAWHVLLLAVEAETCLKHICVWWISTTKRWAKVEFSPQGYSWSTGERISFRETPRSNPGNVKIPVTQKGFHVCFYAMVEIQVTVHRVRRRSKCGKIRMRSHACPHWGQRNHSNLCITDLVLALVVTDFLPTFWKENFEQVCLA